nr:hypothetical protein [Thermoflexales bacterium]
MESYGRWDYAIGFYQQAIAYAPYEDTYYRGLGQAYIDKAASLTTTTPAQVNAPPPVATLLALKWESVAQFNRADCLYAALAVFSQARQINPLNADHTVGLAVAYQRLAAAALDARQREQFMAAARQTYAVALTLRPQDAQLQAAQPRP